MPKRFCNSRRQAEICALAPRRSRDIARCGPIPLGPTTVASSQRIPFHARRANRRRARAAGSPGVHRGASEPTSSADTFDYDNGPYHGLQANIEAVRKFGFNCIRVDFNDRNVSEPGVMSQFDDLVAACRRQGVKVIFDNHNNEATAANWDNAAQQTNGLWFDLGPGSDGTDGGGDKGTITDEQFRRDWVDLAKRYAGDDTVIGFDLRNELVAHWKKFPPVWGGGGPLDIHAMYERVGAAIQQVNPKALIICEAIINWQKEAYEGDLSDRRSRCPSSFACRTRSCTPCTNTHGTRSRPRDQLVPRMNRLWGDLVRQNFAPVWIGEIGAPSGPSDEARPPMEPRHHRLSERPRRRPRRACVYRRGSARQRRPLALGLPAGNG